MVASILKIVITRNTICDNLVGFPKSGHIYIALVAGQYKKYCSALAFDLPTQSGTFMYIVMQGILPDGKACNYMN